MQKCSCSRRLQRLSDNSKKCYFWQKWGIKNDYLASVRSLKAILGRRKFFLFLNQDLSDSFIPLGPASSQASSGLPEGSAGRPQTPSYLALLRAGFSMPFLLPETRWALTPPYGSSNIPTNQRLFKYLFFS